MRRLLWVLVLLACTRPEAPPALAAPADLSAPAAAVVAAAPAGPSHAVFSLGDNRLLAHHLRDGDLVIAAGQPGFAKYVRFGRERGWKLNQTVEGQRVAQLTRAAAVEFPLTSAPASFSIYLFSPEPQKLTVKWNGVATNRDVARGWQTIDVPAPPGVAPGEQRVDLAVSRKPLAIAELRIGARPAAAPTPTWKDGFVLPAGGGLAYYLYIPKGARLVADAAPGCRLAVRAPGLDGTGADVSLAPLAGRIVRLELTSASACTLLDARLVVPGAAPTAPTARPRPKHVVFWIMDSLRADALRPFNPAARAEVPHMEALAARSAVFLNAYVEGNESRVSHGSIWSSMLPVRHRMYKPTQSLDRAFVTLAEAMKAAGYRTAGVTANGWIVGKHGFGDGWDAYRNHIHLEAGLRGADILDTALAQVAAKPTDPWFLYIGTIDTHVSWRAKEPWISKYDPEPYHGKYKTIASGQDMDRLGKTKVPERDQRRIRALYDSNVSYQDMLLGRLIEKLTAWGIADDTMIVILADHGDELFEDGRVGHGASLRETLVHVPLLVHYPPLFPAGTVAEGVHAIDVLPTLLDAAGAAPLEAAQGESLLPLAHGVGAGYPRPAFSSQYERAHVMRLAGWKLRAAADGTVTLHHIAEDPFERQDHSATHHIERRYLTDALSTYLVYQERWQKRRWGVASNAVPALAGDLEK